MRSLPVTVLVAAFMSAAGCVGEPSFEIAANHPAHADAEAAPPRPTVTALDPQRDETVAHAPATHTGRDHGHVHAEHAAPATAEAAAPATKPPVPYPLDVCLVSDEKLGGHGKPYVFEHEGREIKLCCKMCLKDFHKEPAVYMKKLDDAAKKMQPPVSPPAHSGHDHKH